MAREERGGVRRLAFWESPADQPWFARPALLAIALVAAVLSGWRAGTYLEGYYAAAVRSMSMSWHNFAFASFIVTVVNNITLLEGLFGRHITALRRLLNSLIVFFSSK